MPRRARSTPTTKEPSFLEQTWQMLDDGHAEISWSGDGTTITVSNPERLAEHVLPKYYKHGQYSSWVRALNAYDFKKTGAGKWQHESFRRSRPDLVSSIKRKPTKKTAQASSTALVHPSAALSLTAAQAAQQQWQWMQEEMARLERELLSSRRDEFQQRFDFVRLVQMLLKRGVAPSFLPAFQSMESGTRRMLTSKCKLLLQLHRCSAARQRDGGHEPAPLSRHNAVVMLQRAARMRAASAASPRTASTASDVDIDVAAPRLPFFTLHAPARPPPLITRSDDIVDVADGYESDGSLGSLPIPLVASPSRMSDVDLEELGFDQDDYHGLLRGGSGMGGGMGDGMGVGMGDGMGGGMDGSESPLVAGAGGYSRWPAAPASPSPSTALCPLGRAQPAPNGREATQRCNTMRFASMLAAMPTLPSSTAKLPPEGSQARSAIEAAVHLAFKQLTISAGQQATGTFAFGQQAATPPVMPMMVSSMA